MNFEIRNDIPCPRTGRRVYPWPELQVGGSFFLPANPNKKGQRSSLYASAHAYAETHPGFKIVSDREGDGYRVWRVA